MRIYVAGPMRGVPNFNFPAFNAATARLRAAGHEVFNPAERDVDKHGDGLFKTPTATVEEIEAKGFSLRDALEADTSWICRNADVIVLLDGWENSEGAKAEAQLGRALHLQLIPIGEVEAIL